MLNRSSLKPREGCLHGEVETSVHLSRLTCRLCGTFVTLPRYPTIKNHKHVKSVNLKLFAGNGRAYWFCLDKNCEYEQEYF